MYVRLYVQMCDAVLINFWLNSDPVFLKVIYRKTSIFQGALEPDDDDDDQGIPISEIRNLPRLWFTLIKTAQTWESISLGECGVKWSLNDLPRQATGSRAQ